VSIEIIRHELFDSGGRAGTRIRRSRFLMISAAGLFATATKLFLPDAAKADVFPCHGCPLCNCCVAGPGCCSCDGGGPCLDCGCSTNPYSACWYVCSSGYYWNCCDFRQGGACCICKQFTGTPCS
jgi:hypothetical protein